MIGSASAVEVERSGCRFATGRDGGGNALSLNATMERTGPSSSHLKCSREGPAACSIAHRPQPELQGLGRSGPWPCTRRATGSGRPAACHKSAGDRQVTRMRHQAMTNID